MESSKKDVDSRFKKIKKTLESYFISKGHSLSSPFLESQLILNKTKKNNESTEDLSQFNNDQSRKEIETNQSFSSSNKEEDEENKENAEKRKVIRMIIQNNKSNSFSSNDSQEKIEENPIKISDFISKTTNFLIELQNKIDINTSKINTKHTISTDLYKRITESIEVLYDEIFFYETSNKVETSYLSVSLKKIQHLPNGEYNFRLLVKEFNSHFNLMLYERKILSNKKLIISNPYETINIYAMNFDKEDNTFGEVYLNIIQQNTLENYVSNGGRICLKRISVQDIYSIFNKPSMVLNRSEERESIKGSQSQSQSQSQRKSMLENKIRFMNKSTPRLKNQGMISQITNDLQSNLSIKSSNKFQSDIRKLPLTFNIDETTGLNIYEFGLLVERNGEVLGSSEESLLDFFLLHVNEIVDLKVNQILSNYNTSIKIKDEYLIKQRPKYSTANIVLGIDMYLTNKLKYSILKKIQMIYKEKLELLSRRERKMSEAIGLFSSKRVRIVQILTNTEEIEDMTVEEINSEICCKACSSCGII